MRSRVVAQVGFVGLLALQVSCARSSTRSELGDRPAPASDAEANAATDSGDGEDSPDVTTPDGGGCTTPQPVCPSPQGGHLDVVCCTQTTACGVCYGDGFTTSQCLNGAWTCAEGWSFFSDCRGFWSPGADAGPLPECDAG